jgi:hypothetical protein
MNLSMSKTVTTAQAEGDLRAQSGTTLLDKGSDRPLGRAGFILQTDPNSAHGGLPAVVELPASPDPASILKAPPPPYLFLEELRSKQDEIRELQLRVESRMEALKEAFNSSMPRSRLRLRPWSRRKGEPPYAIYWVLLTKKRTLFENRTWQIIEDPRPRWFKRLKIRTRWDLDLAIHRAGMDAVRRDVHRFHGDLVVLNAAHRTLARGLDSIRKMMGSRAAGGRLNAPVVPPLRDESTISWETAPLIRQAWTLECLLRRTTGDLKTLAHFQAKQPGWLRFRLEFRQSEAEPYGRLVWRDLETRSTYASLDDRTKRRLGIPAAMRGLLTPFELSRRDLARALRAQTGVLRRVRARAAKVLLEVRTLLDALKVSDSFSPFLENGRYL